MNSLTQQVINLRNGGAEVVRLVGIDETPLYTVKNVADITLVHKPGYVNSFNKNGEPAKWLTRILAEFENYDRTDITVLSN